MAEWVHQRHVIFERVNETEIKRPLHACRYFRSFWITISAVDDYRCEWSHYITSHNITSHYITSHNITSYSNLRVQMCSSPEFEKCESVGDSLLRWTQLPVTLLAVNFQLTYVQLSNPCRRLLYHDVSSWWSCRGTVDSRSPCRCCAGILSAQWIRPSDRGTHCRRCVGDSNDEVVLTIL